MSVGFRDGEDLFFPAYTFPNWTVILRAVLSERITSVVVVSTAGDHIVLIGKVEHYSTTEGAPLGYHAGAYFSVTPQVDLVAAAARSGNVRIGAILRQGETILLRKKADGSLRVPCAPSGTTGHDGLTKALSVQGLSLDRQTLYAVYEDTADSRIGIFYHGTATGPCPSGFEAVEIHAMPLERISNGAEQSMLQRFAKEHQHGHFGIYQGTQDTGTVHNISV